jgi:hypothetical protein
LPGDIPAGQVKIRGRGYACTTQLCAGGRLKRLLMGIEEFNTFSRRRRCPQQRAERTTMHHAETGVLARLKCQRVNIIPPNGCSAGWHQSIIGVATRQLAGTLSNRDGDRKW